MRSIVFGCVLTALAAAGSAADGPKNIQAKSPTGKGGYKLESVLQIGGGEAGDEAQFYEKLGRTDVDADAQGRIYVLDSGGPRIQVFDAQGHFVRSFGKSGEGPGEMKMPSLLAVGRDGKLAVFDIGLQRISVFDAQGKLTRDQLVQGPVRDMLWDAQGNLVVASKLRGGDALEAYDASGKVVWSEKKDAADAVPAGGRRIMIEMGNETVAPRLALAKNGDVFEGSGEEYGLNRLAQGNVVQNWTRGYERQTRAPMPMPTGDNGGNVVMIRRTEGGSAGAGAQTSVTTSGSGEHSSTMSFTPEDLQKMLPKYSPDVRGLLAWPDGRVWVLTSTNEGDNMVVDEWTDAGEYAKRFAIGSQYARLRLAADGKLYGVSHDRDQYPIVHRLNAVPIVP